MVREGKMFQVLTEGDTGAFTPLVRASPAPHLTSNAGTGYSFRNLDFLPFHETF